MDPCCWGALTGSSPHTRGAQPTGAVRVPEFRIIPAYAGSTWTRSRSGSGNGDHPRIRGEHTAVSIAKGEAGGSSPHTRGARRPGRENEIRERIIPAYAGSTAFARLREVVDEDHPRIRGEHVGCQVVLLAVVGSSPHTRGAPAEAPPAPMTSRDHPRIRGEHNKRDMRRNSSHGSSPHTRGARAFPDCRQARQSDHPRIRGEHLTVPTSATRRGGSSPHTRGARLAGERRHSGVGIIPAYAGSTEGLGQWSRRDTGSSPHTRGARGRPRVYPISSRIIPAYAGSTPPHEPRRRRLWDHPRIRGEHSALDIGGAELDGIIPAYAGSTTSTASTPPWRRDHPRIRGEHPAMARILRSASGSSPHTRGAQSSIRPCTRSTGIIPAYAGSTTAYSTWPRYSRDHPRIRGEHGDRVFLRRLDEGSSPHTRGARAYRGA